MSRRAASAGTTSGKTSHVAASSKCRYTASKYASNAPGAKASRRPAPAKTSRTIPRQTSRSSPGTDSAGAPGNAIRGAARNARGNSRSSAFGSATTPKRAATRAYCAPTPSRTRISVPATSKNTTARHSVLPGRGRGLPARRRRAAVSARDPAPSPSTLFHEDVGEGLVVRGTLHAPPGGAELGLVLTHGAGSSSTSPLLVALAGRPGRPGRRGAPLRPALPAGPAARAAVAGRRRTRPRRAPRRCPGPRAHRSRRASASAATPTAAVRRACSRRTSRAWRVRSCCSPIRFIRRTGPPSSGSRTSRVSTRPRSSSTGPRTRSARWPSCGGR